MPSSRQARQASQRFQTIRPAAAPAAAPAIPQRGVSEAQRPKVKRAQGIEMKANSRSWPAVTSRRPLVPANMLTICPAHRIASAVFPVAKGAPKHFEQRAAEDDEDQRQRQCDV